MRTHSLVLAGAALLMMSATSSAVAQGREVPPDAIALQDSRAEGAPDCSNPTVVSDIPAYGWIDTGNTCGAPAVVSEYRSPSCNAPSYPGPERIYQWELFANNATTVFLQPDAQTDLGIFMVADCSTPTSCVDYHDAIGAGVASGIPRLQVGPYEPGTYYIFVDSYYATGAASCGDYTLTINGEIPVELIRFSIE